jgi:hypothetical protein
MGASCTRATPRGGMGRAFTSECGVRRGIGALTLSLIGWALIGGPAVAAGPTPSRAWAAVRVEPRSAPLPSILEIAPNNGSVGGGTTVRISGEGFPRDATVEFGDTRTKAVTVRSSTSLEAVSPPGSSAVDVTVTGPQGSSAPTPQDRFAYDPQPHGDWLGLNDNSVSYVGPVGQFVADRVVYDREEYLAGRLPSFHDSLHRAITHHMIPDVVIEYAGYTGRGFGRLDPNFPTGAAIERYVSGFIRTAQAIRRAYPGREIMFEPINEPWGYATPARYAAVVSALLPAARRAGIPLDSIYVGAYGKGWVPAMYAAAPALRTLVGGWYFHPYGLPTGMQGGYSTGIQSLPHVQAEMTSGQNNIIVSEIGWCAEEVNHGAACSQSRTRSARQAARLLTESLDNALPMRHDGWLKALLVYSRSDGGWAMELPHAVLTESGRALVHFVRAHPTD